MLNGPALLRVFLVVIAAAVLAGLVQHYWIFESSPLETSALVARPVTQSATEHRADPAPARSPVQAAPKPTSAPQPAPEPTPMGAPDTRNAAPMPSPQPIASEPPPSRSLPRSPAPSPPTAAQLDQGEQDVPAAGAADPRAVDLVDLNTGSLAELNELKGGGAIGRAIIQRRPYASTDQLLSKRVLSRAIYQRIKDQITIR